MHLAELAIETERFGAFLFGELLRHKEREEEAVLRKDVRGEPCVGPGVVSRILVVRVRQNDDLLELALWTCGVGCSRDDVH